MRKLLLILAMLAMGKAFAAPVPVDTAKTVALNFFKAAAQNQSQNLTATLKYTRTEPNGSADFYVFDISPSKGFVIVSAEDVAQPVIGYSTESNFVTNISANIGLSDWMVNSAAKIASIKQQAVLADKQTTAMWQTYKTGATPPRYRSTTVSPLLSITWNQEPYYNALCPFNSADNERCVTGCVATAMAQIMKFWNYPAQGKGSNSYTASGYGTQSANFGATTYNWANMPASLSANNADIATLMYQCGVSVDMAYGDDNQGGSGAAVIGGFPSAQYSYVNYFSYNGSTIKGVNQSSYTAAAWIALLQGELNAGRPVQYMGFETNGGGHTWVCDGYDANNNFHMNWGWGGYDNGYFSLTNLNPNPYVFNSNDAALIGIQPTSLPSCSVPSGQSTTTVTVSSANFNWTAVSGATGYNVQYRKVGTSTWTSGTTSTNSFSASSLLSAANYEWQVQTVCSTSSTSAFTASSSFTMLTATCTVPTGLSTSSITTNSATFSWAVISGALGYNIQYRKVGTTTWTSGTTSTNSFSASSLLSATNYEWQVQTVCSSTSTSAFTASSTFTTLMATTCSVPTSLSTGSITTSSAKFSWAAVSGALGYNIQYRKVGTTTWTSGTTSTNSFSVSSLASVTNYEGQVQTVCSSSSTSAFTASSTFTTLTATTCSVPTNLSTGSITASSAKFSWTAVSGALDYNIQYRKVGTITWTSYSTSTNSFSASSLSPATNYEWQVQTACSSTSTSAFTASATFTTLTATVTCNTPTGLSAGNIANTSATLSWTSTGANSYNLQWKATTGSSWTTVSGLTTTSYNLSGLVACTSYQFQVQGNCSGTLSSYSAAASFSTIGCSSSTYCTSKGAYTTYEYINNVTIGSINNTSGDNKGYADYTSLSTNLTGGSTVTIKLTPGFHGSAYDEFFTVYVDYNHNGLFTDAGDLVLSVNGISAVSGSFTIPTSALNGATRMRVQMQYGGYETNPCASGFTYGEVEDYTVNITGNAKLTVENPAEEATAFNTDLILYPNPAQNNLNVQFNSENSGTLNLNIYNLVGQKVMANQLPVSEGSNTLNLNTAELGKGVYILETENNGVITRSKFIIAR